MIFLKNFFFLKKNDCGSEAWCIGSVRAYGSEGPEFEPRCCHSFFSGGLWRDLVSPSVWGHNCCSQVRREVPWMERWGYSRRDLKYKGDNLLWVPKTNLGCSSLLGEIGFCYKKYFPRIRKANAMGVPTSTLPWVGKGRGLSKKIFFQFSTIKKALLDASWINFNYGCGKIQIWNGSIINVSVKA